MLHHKKYGFFLFSFSIYMASILLLCSILFSLLFTCYQNIFLITQKSYEIQKIESAFWNIIRTLEKAPSSYTDFKTIKKNLIIWSQDTFDIGCMYDQTTEKLYHIKGTYDLNTEQLKIQEKMLILDDATVTFSYQESPFCIICTIKNITISITFPIFSRYQHYKNTEEKI